jgi:hypothetical protein
MRHDRVHEVLELWQQPHWHRSVFYALSIHDASEDLRLLVGAVVKGMSRELKRCIEDIESGVTRSPIMQFPSLLEKWTDPESIRLAAGEITPPDMRVVLKATKTLADDMKALLPDLTPSAPSCAPRP